MINAFLILLLFDVQQILKNQCKMAALQICISGGARNKIENWAKL
jgi:hypothetical protein